MKSFAMFDNEVREFILQSFPTKSINVLDVGAGSGKFRKLLFDFPNVDAVEVHQPYITKHELERMYRSVYCCDVAKFEEFNSQAFDQYSLVIMGDVLEHMTVEEAQAVLGAIRGTLIVAVPYEYPQEAVNDNAHEEHKQDDLTHQIFMERYEGFKCLVKNDFYGIYVRGMGVERAGTMPKERDWAVDTSKFKDVNICICTPVADMCTTTYTKSLAATCSMFAKNGIELSVAMVQGHSVQQGRNRLVAAMMAEKKFTHLLFIDADHGWDWKNILRLLAFDKDLIGIIARKKTPDVQWAANIPNEGVSIVDGAMEMTSGELGTGFMLIKRTVFDQMFEAYPEMKLAHPSANEVSKAENDNYSCLFQFVIEDGVERSEDLTFCSRWKAIGGTIWADPNAAISHIGSYDYIGCISTIFRDTIEEEAA